MSRLLRARLCAAAAWPEAYLLLLYLDLVHAALCMWPSPQDEASTAAYFQQWQAKHGLSYTPGSAEYTTRLANFKECLFSITTLNLKDTSDSVYVAPNRFCALSRQEFAEQYLGAQLPSSDLQRQGLGAAPQPPDSVDWAAAGRVPRVELQQWVSLRRDEVALGQHLSSESCSCAWGADCSAGAQRSLPAWLPPCCSLPPQCGSAWAYAATAAMEAKCQIAAGQPLSLSQLNLLECVSPSQGCEGGWPHLAFSYGHSSGQATEAAYPLTATVGACKATADADVVRIPTAPGYIALLENSALDLMKVRTASLYCTELAVLGA